MTVDQFYDGILLASLFSLIAALLYLGLMTGILPFADQFAWKSAFGKFAYSVGTGVVTFFLTQWLFGHGTENASVTGFVTAAIIGSVTKVVG